jgi:hypothetical protein
MPTSHYFPLYYKNNSSESNLIQDLVDEQIKLFGSDIYYITRKTFTDNAINDIVYSEFSEKIVIEAMLQNVSGFGEQSEFISKFGLRVTDEITFTMSVRRWDAESIRLNNLKVPSRPNEGDLIYFPLTGDLYEIKFVERETPFYQLGQLYYFSMTCEIYETGQDDIDTGIPEIDSIETENDFAITLVLANGGTGNYYPGDKVEYYNVTTILGSTAYSPTGITAEVAEWDGPSHTIKLINTSGDYTEEYAILKKFNSDYTSNGSWIIGPQAEFTDIDDTNTEFDDNKYIEEAADDILDWSEDNPFGEFGNRNGNF